MNNIDKIKSKVVNTCAFEFGLSPLHCYIRFMENILHIANRIDFKAWQARGDAKKVSVEKQKKRIQHELRNKIGIIVDEPRSGGSAHGSSNDGITARRFFADPLITSQITGISVDLIKRFRVILKTINSGIDINAVKFEKYATEPAKLYTSLYSWYPMPATTHKILMHGSSIIESFSIPVGCLSEEAAEARNKDIGLYRSFHTRKSSQINTNLDLINRLLLSSDPFITSSRKPNRSKLKTDFTDEELSLLIFQSDEEGYNV